MQLAVEQAAVILVYYCSPAAIGPKITYFVTTKVKGKICTFTVLNIKDKVYRITSSVEHTLFFPSCSSLAHFRE